MEVFSLIMSILALATSAACFLRLLERQKEDPILRPLPVVKKAKRASIVRDELAAWRKEQEEALDYQADLKERLAYDDAKDRRNNFR